MTHPRCATMLAAALLTTPAFTASTTGGIELPDDQVYAPGVAPGEAEAWLIVGVRRT